MPDLCRPLLVVSFKTILLLPLNVEFIDFTSLSHISQRDQNVSLVSRPVLIDNDTWRAFVVDQNLSVTSGLVLIGHDVVLQVAHSFKFV